MAQVATGAIRMASNKPPIYADENKLAWISED
jgi:hypothetical protein